MFKLLHLDRAGMLSFSWVDDSGLLFSTFLNDYGKGVIENKSALIALQPSPRRHFDFNMSVWLHCRSSNTHISVGTVHSLS